MRIALIGASGRIGRHIAAEALGLGHHVTALVRAGSAVEVAGVATRLTDIMDADDLAAALRGHDAAISAYRAPEDQPQALASLAATLVQAARATGLRRLLLVGGAGSLAVGTQGPLASLPGFPAALRRRAAAHQQALAVWRGAPDLDWTVLAPPEHIGPGHRTGRHRRVPDQLAQDAKGHSAMVWGDFAAAVLSELADGRHFRALVGVGPAA